MYAFWMENSTMRPLLLSRPRYAASELLAGNPSALSLSMDRNTCAMVPTPDQCIVGHAQFASIWPFGTRSHVDVCCEPVRMVQG